MYDPNASKSVSEHQAYSLLCTSIVNRACLDYIQALIYDDIHTIRDIERFFRSPWYELMCDMDPERLIHTTRENVDKFMWQCFYAHANNVHSGVSKHMRDWAFACPICGNRVTSHYCSLERQKNKIVMGFRIRCSGCCAMMIYPEKEYKKADFYGLPKDTIGIAKTKTVGVFEEGQ